MTDNNSNRNGNGQRKGFLMGRDDEFDAERPELADARRMVRKAMGTLSFRFGKDDERAWAAAFSFLASVDRKAAAEMANRYIERCIGADKKDTRARALWQVAKNLSHSHFTEAPVWVHDGRIETYEQAARRLIKEIFQNRRSSAMGQQSTWVKVLVTGGCISKDAAKAFWNELVEGEKRASEAEKAEQERLVAEKRKAQEETAQAPEAPADESGDEEDAEEQPAA